MLVVVLKGRGVEPAAVGAGGWAHATGKGQQVWMARGCVKVGVEDSLRIEDEVERLHVLCITAWALSLRQWEQLDGPMWQIRGAWSEGVGGGVERCRALQLSQLMWQVRDRE